MKNNKNVKIKLILSVCLAFILVMSFSIVTYALLTASVSVEDNSFQTGTIEINVNDGKPVIEENEFSFEPGMTVVKDFFVENVGTGDAYYKVYFENVEGKLAEVLEVTIQDEELILAKGTLEDLTIDAYVIFIPFIVPVVPDENIIAITSSSGSIVLGALKLTILLSLSNVCNSSFWISLKKSSELLNESFIEL